MLKQLTEYMTRRLERAFQTGRILQFMLLTITAVAAGFGFLMWIVDRDNFPTLGLALWWAVTTVTTVGYGDVVPVDTNGRLVAAALMIFGYSSLSLLTGIVASTLVHRRTTASTDEWVERLESRLAEVERLLREHPR